MSLREWGIFGIAKVAYLC